MDTRARTVTLKLRYADFTTITRSRSVQRPVQEADAIYELAKELLLASTQAGTLAVRLIGVSVSSLQRPGAPEQLWLPLVSPCSGAPAGNFRPKARAG